LLHREDPDTLASVDTPDRDVELSELNQAVAKAVRELPPRCREVFKLARESGFSYAEIAEIMGLSRQTVANHLSLALSDLRVMLRPFLLGLATEGAVPNDIRTTNAGEV
jgi:RNA polymerase sigma-70 factor (ECF subfamily)